MNCLNTYMQYTSVYSATAQRVCSIGTSIHVIPCSKSRHLHAVQTLSTSDSNRDKKDRVVVVVVVRGVYQTKVSRLNCAKNGQNLKNMYEIQKN